MNENIRRLVRLQEIGFEIRELQSIQEAAPQRMATLEAEFIGRKEEIGAARIKHESLVADHARYSKERDEVQVRLQQTQHKLMQVTNSREYSAVLNEIDQSKSKIRVLEDQILECEGAIEELAGPAAEADEKISQERERVDSLIQKIREETNQAEVKLSEINAQREEITRLLPPDYVNRYENIFKARQGVVMARLDKESCGACHVRLRPQVISLVRRSEDIVCCDSCRRILYIEENDTPPQSGETGTPPPGVPDAADAGT